MGRIVLAALGPRRVRTTDDQVQHHGDDGGALTFKKAPNYEMPADAGGNNVYNVTVVVTDDPA